MKKIREEPTKIAMHDVVYIHTVAKLASTIVHFILEFIVDDFQTYFV